MDYKIKMLIVAFIISLIAGRFILPILRKLKIGQSEREDGPKSHLKKSGTPTMGGVIIIVGVIISALITYLYNKELAEKIMPILLASLGFGLIGFIDDYEKVVKKNTDGISPKAKMLGLLIIAVLFVMYLVNSLNISTAIIIPFFKISIILPSIIYIIFTIFVILATTNAVNLTDGIDGLSTSVSIVIIATLGVIGTICLYPEIGILGAIVCGGCLGFLPYNLNRARVFMGDTGSLFLGGIISCMAIYMGISIALIIIAIIPVCETLSVIIQVAYYKRTKKRVFKMTPIHHHFELSGWNENKVVRRFTIATIIACIIGALSVI